MKGDFTRSTFRPEKHYSRVLQQQGRVQLDADWNEALDILTHRQREALIDIIGRCCAPEGNAGFEITAAANGDLGIGAGRYYVDGILVENDADQLFTEQGDLPGAGLPVEQRRFIIYLDVWERHITALEDPDIREVALGGPDTATRTQVLGQVKLLAADDGATCDNLGRGWEPEAGSGTLAARSQPADDEEEPCDLPPAAGYRRLENQLYRVEIYQGGTLGDPQDEPTFTYSRENGSVVFELVGPDIITDTLVIAGEGRDENLSFHPNDWVELTDDTRELHGRRGILLQLSNVEGRELTFLPGTAVFPEDLNAIPTNFNQFGPHPKVRRWESEGAELVEKAADNDGYLRLESGVEILFGDGNYQTGDYWLIPARTNLGDVLWPLDPTSGEPSLEATHGIKHHYCALAMATFTPSAAAAGGSWTNINDCRSTFPPLCELPQNVVVGEGDSSCCCCGITVGDGEISDGDFNNLQEAVKFVIEQERDGHICVLPGRHQLEAAVRIENVRNLEITIAGCGRSSVILNSQGQPAFEIIDSRVRLLDLVIDASSAEPAVVNATRGEIVIENCDIRNATPAGSLAESPTVYFNACTRAALRGCRLQSTPAVVSSSSNVQLLDNRARGGFWLERGSQDVVVAGNEIREGRLQGITLGGVRIEPLRDGPVQRITIRDNHISSMEQSAIGSAIEQQQIEALGQIESLVISQNRLRDNAFVQKDERFNGQTQGGIVLHGVLGGRIHDNEISGNGLAEIPACGICLTWATGIEIKDNHIAGNGPFVEPGTVIETDHLQGGIFLLPVLGGAIDINDDQFIRPGGPAFQVHDNVVVTPAGPCLTAYGYGPMSIRDNAFTSRAVVIQTQPVDDLSDEFSQHLFDATNVSVFNLAMNASRESRELPAGSGLVFFRDELLGSLKDRILAAEDIGITPAGQLAYHGNQSDQTGAPRGTQQFASPSVALVSFGDAAAQDNQSVCHLTPPGQQKQLADWRVLGGTTRVQDNWVDEDPEQTIFSIVAFGEHLCHTSHNQAAECIFAFAGSGMLQEIANQVLNPDNCLSLIDEFIDFLPG